jgi:hypothetical protein
LQEEIDQWHKEKKLWETGNHPDQIKRTGFKPGEQGYCSFEEWHGLPPDPTMHMPYWPKEECTHYQMYETTSEGTPISPVCKSPEELAKWLTDNKASAFAEHTATYEEWLRMIKGTGFAVSAVFINNELVSGIRGMENE